MPLISVIIPTRYRPQLVQRAIHTALTQSFGDLEVIVIVDGPDPETIAALSALSDDRVLVVALDHNVGLAEARNVGVRHARGQWVAFLDDDDEWLPEKLKHQVEAAAGLAGDYVFVACRFLERTRTIERVMPESLPAPGQHFSEYIYCHGGYLQPSTFFASTTLLQQVPFTAGLRHIEDTDWLLRAMSHAHIKVAVVPEVLSVYNNFKDGTRESEMTSCRGALAWAKTNHHLFTKRAFPYYVARLCLNARRTREPLSTFVVLLLLASRYGRLNGKVLSYFLAYTLVSEATLKRLRRLTKTFSPRANAPQPSLAAR